ncbi:MAG: phosphatase PAP2 family protein [Holophaga sp.]|nr:phosphatase PAP2 family protein [Holophaga sp.]
MHMLNTWGISLAFVLGSLGFIQAETPQVPRFLVGSKVDFVAAIPPPPAPGSLAAAADLEAVLQVQVWRTPKSVAWAKAVHIGTVWNFSETLGPWFVEAKLPRLALLFRDIGKELGPISAAAKTPFQRPRPFRMDARVLPCIPPPEGFSYPSGHALYLFMQAEVLAEIFPGARQALFDYAHRAAWGRILAGVHFPTDLVAGQILAKTFVDEIKKSAAFQDEIMACQIEAKPFLGLKRKTQAIAPCCN